MGLPDCQTALQKKDTFSLVTVWGGGEPRSQNIRRQDIVLQVGTQLGPAIFRIRIILAEAREGKNKDPKKVHCAAVAEKRNSILQPGLLGGGDGVMAKQRKLLKKLSALMEMSSPALKNTLSCPDLTEPFF